MKKLAMIAASVLALGGSSASAATPEAAQDVKGKTC